MSESQFIVEMRGSTNWPRFIVRDGLGRFWNGEGWGLESEALVFHEQYAASKKAMEFTLGKKLRHFTTTVNVIVEGDEPITVEQLCRFIDANLFVGLGNDGSDEAFDRLRVDVDVDLSELEEVE